MNLVGWFRHAREEDDPREKTLSVSSSLSGLALFMGAVGRVPTATVHVLEVLLCLERALHREGGDTTRGLAPIDKIVRWCGLC